MAWALASGFAFAAEEEADEPALPEKAEAKDKELKPIPEPRSVRTQHELCLDGQVLKYTATVGWLILNNKEKDEPIARYVTDNGRWGSRDTFSPSSA